MTMLLNLGFKQPNVAYYDDLTVVTLKAVKAGAELLHDYGDEWE